MNIYILTRRNLNVRSTKKGGAGKANWGTGQGNDELEMLDVEINQVYDDSELKKHI